MKKCHLRCWLPWMPVAFTTAFVLYLGRADPRVDVFCSTQGKSLSLVFLPGDPRIATQVGKLTKDFKAIEDTGREGFLVFGPYLAVPAGCYRITWFGQAVTVGQGIRFDVFSTDLIPRVLKDQVVRSEKTYPTAEMATLAVELTQAVRGLEFRVWVDSSARARIEQINLDRLDCTPRRR